MRTRNDLAVILTAVLLILDQATKLLADSFLRANTEFVLIPGVFELHYLENRSAAFGIDPVSLLQKLLSIAYFDEHPEVFLLCKMGFFVVLTMAVSIGIIWFYRRIPQERRFVPMRIALLLFLSGAIGNCIDRLWHRYVIDFLYFRLIDFPIFNVADIYVTVATALLILLCFFYYKEEDMDRILSNKKEKHQL